MFEAGSKHLSDWIVGRCVVRSDYTGGSKGDRFGLSSEVAVYCNAEQLREAINAWQAVVAIELSRMSPP